jgi:uncharacterized protein (TIGR03083 family)
VSAPREFAARFGLERARLLGLLRALGPDDWSRATGCPGWTVLDLAVHLVGVDALLTTRAIIGTPK